MAYICKITIASLFDILAFQSLRGIIRRRLDQHMTAMILMRVVIAVCLSLPFNTYRAFQYISPFLPSNPMSCTIDRLIHDILIANIGGALENNITESTNVTNVQPVNENIELIIKEIDFSLCIRSVLCLCLI